MKISTAVSKYLTGRRKPAWVKEKIRNTLIDRPLLETTRLKMMGRVPWNKNKPFYAIRGEKHWAWDKEKKNRYELRGRLEINNGRTLYKDCHQKTYTYLWKAIKKLQDNQE